MNYVKSGIYLPRFRIWFHRRVLNFDTKIRDRTDRSFVDFFSSRQRNDEAVWTESVSLFRCSFIFAVRKSRFHLSRLVKSHSPFSYESTAIKRVEIARNTYVDTQQIDVGFQISLSKRFAADVMQIELITLHANRSP